MNELLARIIEAHGGMDRWKGYEKVEVTIVSGDLMLRRHDYNVNIAGGFGGAQLTSNYIQANGIGLPNKRRAYTRGPDNYPILDMLMVAIDISNVSFT